MTGKATRRRVAGPALVAVALAASMAAGCSSDADRSTATTSTRVGYVGRRAGPRVTIAGDSITELSRAAILAALTDEYRVRVDAFSGHTIAEVTPALRRQVATHPAIAVVNLGTNDMERENPQWRADLDRMLALVADVPCVEIFTIYDGHDRPTAAMIGTGINARLETTAATGSVHLIDWNAAVHAEPDLVVADRIHPNDAGQRWIAASTRDAIRRDC